MKHVFVWIFVSAAFCQNREGEFQSYYHEAVRTYEAKNYDSAAYFFQKADDIRPNTHSVKYNLAASLSLAGKVTESARVLREDFWLQATPSFLQDSDFVNIWKDPLTKTLSAEIDFWNRSLSKSEKVLQLDDRGFHPEGLAYDAETKRFILGSIRKQCIWIFQNGKIQKSFFKSDSLYSVMGMRIDAKGRKLWVCTSAMPEMEYYIPSLEGRAAVCRFNLDNGELEKIYRAEGNHIFGDLILSEKGDVFISDSKVPAIYRIDKKTDRLELWQTLENAWNLQGLDFSKDETSLFVADYIAGIFKINTRTKQVIPIVVNNPLRGIDGLYRSGNDFIVTQNGTNPLRVSRLKMNTDQTKIVDIEFLEKATPILDEPTLGVVVGEEFYYVANSPWGAYDKAGKFLEDKADLPTVYKIQLKP